jgi:hypothetical protein
MTPSLKHRDGGRRSAATWRARALVEIQDLRAQVAWMVTSVPDNPTIKPLSDAVDTQLNQAERVVKSRGPRFSLITGADIQATREYIDAAAINLMRLSPPEYLASQLPSVLANARRHLSGNDPRLQGLAKVYERSTGGPGMPPVPRADRLAIVAAEALSLWMLHRRYS